MTLLTTTLMVTCGDGAKVRRRAKDQQTIGERSAKDRRRIGEGSAKDWRRIGEIGEGSAKDRRRMGGGSAKDRRRISRGSAKGAEMDEKILRGAGVLWGSCGARGARSYVTKGCDNTKHNTIHIM